MVWPKIFMERLVICHSEHAGIVTLSFDILICTTPLADRGVKHNAGQCILDGTDTRQLIRGDSSDATNVPIHHTNVPLYHLRNTNITLK